MGTEGLSPSSPGPLYHFLLLSQFSPSQHHPLAIRKPGRATVNGCFPGNPVWITTNSAHPDVPQTLSVVCLSIFMDPRLEGIPPSSFPKRTCTWLVPLSNSSFSRPSSPVNWGISSSRRLSDCQVKTNSMTYIS